MNKLEKTEEELKKAKRREGFLFAIIIILLIGLTIQSLYVETLEDDNENLCYLSNNMVDLINQFSSVLEIETHVEKLDCHSGDAERRLNDE
jgi:hypothetical protein